MKRERKERGAVALEFVLVAMLLMYFGLGIAEFGLAWQDRMTVQSATRAAARVGTNLSTNSAADYNMLLTLNSAIQDVGVGSIQNVVIYKAAAADGLVPTSCVSAAGVVASVTNVCNAYTGAQLASLLATQFGSCGASGKLDNAWCPVNRQNVLAAGPDYLGVWVRVSRPRISKLFGSSPMKITDWTVMRLEPLT